MSTSSCPSHWCPATGIPTTACPQANPCTTTHTQIQDLGRTTSLLPPRLSHFGALFAEQGSSSLLFSPSSKLPNLGLGGAWLWLEPFPCCPGTQGLSGVPKRRPSISRSFEAPSEDKGGPSPGKEAADCGDSSSEAVRECHGGQYPGLDAPSLSQGALTICSLCRSCIWGSAPSPERARGWAAPTASTMAPSSPRSLARLRPASAARRAAGWPGRWAGPVPPCRPRALPAAPHPCPADPPGTPEPARGRNVTARRPAAAFVLPHAPAARGERSAPPPNFLTTLEGEEILDVAFRAFRGVWDYEALAPHLLPRLPIPLPIPGRPLSIPALDPHPQASVGSRRKPPSHSRDLKEERGRLKVMGL